MKYTLILFAAFIVTSCTQSSIPFFESESGVDFLYTNGRTLKYSFLGNPELPSYNLTIPVKITGETADYERIVNVSILADSTTATSSDYEIIGGVIKANEYAGVVTVKLLNTTILKSKTLRLWLLIDESKDFMKGNFENKSFELLWDNMMSEPSNWRRYGFGTYSTTIYKFMIETLGLTYIDYPGTVSYLQMEAYKAKMRTTLKEYNRLHPTDKLRHEDGEKNDQLVVIP